MPDNILTKDRDGANIALSAKDIGGVLAPRNILTDPSGNDITPLTDASLRAAPVETRPSESIFLDRLAFRALAKMTYTLTGIRVDCGGSSVAISSGTVTTVATTTTLAGIGYNNQNGQSIQQSQLAIQCGFRRNIA